MCVKYSTVVNVVKGFKGKTCVTRFGEMFFLNWAILASLFKYLWKMKSTLTIFHSCQWPPNIEQTIWPSAHTVWLNHRQDSMGTVEMKGYSAPLEYTCAACWTKKLKLRMDFLSAKNFTFQSKLSRILVPTMTTVFFSLQSVCYTPLSLSLLFIHTIYPHFYFLSVNRRYNIYKKSMWKIRFVRGFKLTNSQPRVS